MENLNSRPNFLTIIGRAIAKYADRSTAFISARLERMYQAHMERAQMRLAPNPMAMCAERRRHPVPSAAVVGKELPLAEAARAHKEILESGSLGKIVLIC